MALGFVWLLGVWPPPLWWRTHWPERTSFMRAVPRSDRASIRLVPLAEISPILQRMVIIAEDSRFRTHWGVDLIELREAAQAGMRRGASTITQQLAKNLYLSPSRSPLRKLKEAATAVRLEWALSKDRILELYLNSAEWGDGIWGIEAASREYYGTSPRALTEEQAAALAATLPHPRSSNPAYRPERMRTRRELILARYRGRNVVIPPVAEPDLDSVFDVDSLVDSLGAPEVVPGIPESLPPLPDTVRDSTRDSTPPPNDTGPAARRP